jgi:hypothetical protein
MIVLGGFPTTTQRAAHFRAEHAGQITHAGQQFFREWPSLIEADTLPDGIHEGDAFENLLLAFRAEAFQLGHRAGFAGGLQLRDIVQAESFEEQFRFLRTQPGNAQKGEQPGGDRRPQFIEIRQGVRGGEGVNLLRDRFTDAANRFEFREGHRPRVAFKLAQGAGGVAVGVAAEAVFSLEFQQDSDFFEMGGDGVGGHAIDSREATEGRCGCYTGLRRRSEPPW